MRALAGGLFALALSVSAATACGSNPPPLYKAIPTVPTKTVAIGAAALATAITLADPSRAGRKDEKDEANLGREKKVTEQVPSDVLDRADKPRMRDGGAVVAPAPDAPASALLPLPPGLGCQLDAALLSDEALLPVVLAVCPAPAVESDLDLSLRDDDPDSNR